MAAERVELRTIYLVDLVGSTRLATSLGPVRADELRDEFFGVLREAITATGGEEFKNTGDGLFAAFASASAAVACAVLTHQLLERRSRGSEHPLRARIGLGTGESTMKDGDYFGMPSIEAARLCDKAPTDGILVSPATRMLAGRVDGAQFEPFGALELKGLPEPMDAWSVRWEPLDPEHPAEGIGRWPLPGPLQLAPQVAYVGRDAERARLERTRSTARAGARQVVLIAGEPGIGKTRLASYAALGANADGFAVCWGCCSEDLAAPYEPWIAVCAQLVDHLPDDVLAGYIGRTGGEVGRIAPGLHRRVPDAPPPRAADPETEQLLLFNAIAELLRAAAGSVPLCVVIDDFHWADGQSVALLKHVARSVEHGALQILVTYRDSDIGRGHPLPAVLADLRRTDGVERVALSGLDADEIAQLLQVVAGHELDEAGTALAAELAGETGGNPFFVGEMLRNMAESGALAPDEASGRWRADRSLFQRLPESVREVITHRVDRLGDQGREILTAAAVIGRTFDVAVLAELVDVDEAGLLDVLEEACHASLLRESTEPVGRFGFEHALINHTLYQSLGASRRARMHQRVAEILERHVGRDPGARVGELAGHWDKAAGLDVDKAIAYARLAGDHALAGLAPDEGVRWYERALELLASRDDRALQCDLLIGLGEAQRRTSNAAYRRTLLDASRIASDLGDGERAARAALANNRGQTSAYGHIDEERVAAIERALELDDHRDRRARLLAFQATELLYEPDADHRKALVEEALAVARELDDPDTTATVLLAWFRIHQTAEGLRDRRRHVDELERVGAGSGDSPVAFFAISLVRNVFVESGMLDRVPGATAQMEGIAARLKDPLLTWVTAYCGRACWALLHGSVDEAEHHAQEALRIGTELGEPDALMMYGAQLVPIRILQGRAGEILDLLDQAIQANPRLLGFQAAKAQILSSLGRVDEARAMLDEATATRFEHVAREQTRAVGLAMYAEAAAQTGATDAAAILYALLEPTADQIAWNGANTCGHLRIYLGLLAATLGRDDEADEHFARAIEVQERGGILIGAARAHLGWAEALAARGDAARARDHAARAHELSRERGCDLFATRAAALL
jgi:class 3 adenylate cyclase